MLTCFSVLILPRVSLSFSPSLPPSLSFSLSLSQEGTWADLGTNHTRKKLDIWDHMAMAVSGCPSVSLFLCVCVCVCVCVFHRRCVYLTASLV